MISVRRLLAAIAVTALLPACNAVSDRVEDPPTVTVPTGGSTSSPTSTATPSRPSDGVQTIEVSYVGGAVTPRAYKPKVPVGAKVRLVVRADVSDEVHVHTYDKKAVISGGVATIDFTADIPGIFEVELEGKGVVLLNLQVG